MAPVTYPGVRIDRDYFVGGAWADYGKIHADYSGCSQYWVERLGLKGKRVGVLGCAYGFSVVGMRIHGVDAWGVDVSEFAIQQWPSAGPWLLLADATTEDGMDAFAERAGGRFDVLVDENLLPLLTDEEAVAACELWRAHADEVVHLINMCREQPRVYNPDLENDGARHNWHSPTEWRSLIGDGDRLVEFANLREY